MNTPTPAVVTRRAARRLPRVALLLLCIAYVLPGVFSRDPWRNADITAFGYMLSIAEGRSPWMAPALGGLPAEAALLPHWLGALFISGLSPWLDPALAARVPFAGLLALVLALTWYTTFHLARTDAAQPVALAFGGEADTVDYARAIADAAVLALIATLGLLQLGHETTPELPQLFGVSLYMWSLAVAPFRTWRARLGTLVSLVLISGSGAPAMALAMGLAGALVCKRSSYPNVRHHALWVAAGTGLGAVLAWWLGAWHWRISADMGLHRWTQAAKLFVWFLWPTWLLALWTLWRWRRHLQKRHVSVPLVAVAVAVLACLGMGNYDRALMLGLPGLAVLAAFALPTLNRSTTAAIDWFSMILFTLVAGALWVIYCSVQWGVPAKPAANVVRLAPGFETSFSLLSLALAAAATAGWFWVLRWRTGRHREALWTSLVLPAGGTSLCWLLLMTLGLPIVDYARSIRPLIALISRHAPAGSCVVATGQAPSLIAALEYFGQFSVQAKPGSVDPSCPFLVRMEPKENPPNAPSGWVLVARERRPTDRTNLAAVYRREPP